MSDNTNQSILQAIEILVNKKIEQISFDSTIKAVIVKDDEAEDGKYWCSNGSSEFWAYSTNTNYKKNDNVMVTVPQGDYTNQKIIVCKQANENTSPLTYVSPFATMVDLTNNLIGKFTCNYADENALAIWANEELDDITNYERAISAIVNEAAFAPNSKTWQLFEALRLTEGELNQFSFMNNGARVISDAEGLKDYIFNKPIYQLDPKDAVFSWDINEKDFKKSNAYRYGEPFFDSGEKLLEQKITRLGVQAQFSTWLTEYMTISGNYGIVVELTFRCLDLPPETTYERANGLIYLHNDYYVYDNQNEKYDKITMAQKQYAATHDPIEDGENVKFKLRANDSGTALYIQKKQNEFTNYVTFDSDDFFGDVYGYETYFTNEIVFDLSEFVGYPITRIRAWMYQRNNFKTVEGEYVPAGSAQEFSDVSANIFMKDPYICLGIESDEFLADTAYLQTDSSSSYFRIVEDVDNFRELEERQENNFKYIKLRWVHKDTDTGIIRLVEQSDFPQGYEVRWYRWELGAPSPDQFAGAHWVRYYGCKDDPDENGDYCIKESEYLSLIGNETTNGWMTLNNATDQLLITFKPNVNKAKEQIKAIILKTEAITNTVYRSENNSLVLTEEDNGVIYRFAAASDIMEFTNKDEVRSQQTYLDMNALSIRFNDLQQGHYFIYNRAGNASKQADLEIRTLTAVFDEDEDDVFKKAQVPDSAELEWTFPPAAETMISPASSSQLNAVPTSETKFYNTPIVGYFIKKSLDRQANNNWVRLKAKIDGVTYTAEAQMVFGTAGTNGSDYTLDLMWRGPDRALDVTDPNSALLVGEVGLFDSAGYQVLEDLETSRYELQYDWLVQEYIEPTGTYEDEVYDYEYETQNILYPVYFNTDSILKLDENDDKWGGFYYFLDVGHSKFVSDLKSFLFKNKNISNNDSGISIQNDNVIISGFNKNTLDGYDSNAESEVQNNNSIIAKLKSKTFTYAVFNIETEEFIYLKDQIISILANALVDTSGSARITALSEIFSTSETSWNGLQFYRKKDKTQNLQIEKIEKTDAFYRDIFEAYYDSSIDIYGLLLEQYYFSETSNNIKIWLESLKRSANDMVLNNTSDDNKIIVNCNNSYDNVIIKEAEGQDQVAIEMSEIQSIYLEKLISLVVGQNEDNIQGLEETLPSRYQDKNLEATYRDLLDSLNSTQQGELEVRLEWQGRSEQTVAEQKKSYNKKVFETLFSVNNFYYNILQKLNTNPPQLNIGSLQNPPSLEQYYYALYRENSFEYIFVNDFSNMINDANSSEDLYLCYQLNSDGTKTRAPSEDILYEWDKPKYDFQKIQNVYGKPDDYDPDFWDNSRYPATDFKEGDVFWQTGNLVEKDSNFYLWLYNKLIDSSFALSTSQKGLAQNRLDSYIANDLNSFLEYGFSGLQGITGTGTDLFVSTDSGASWVEFSSYVTSSGGDYSSESVLSKILELRNGNAWKSGVVWSSNSDILDLTKTADAWNLYNALNNILFGADSNIYSNAIFNKDALEYSSVQDQFPNWIILDKSFTNNEWYDFKILTSFLKPTGSLRTKSEQKARYNLVINNFNEADGEVSKLQKALLQNGKEDLYGHLIAIMGLDTSTPTDEREQYLINYFNIVLNSDLFTSETEKNKFVSDLLYKDSSSKNFIGLVNCLKTESLNSFLNDKGDFKNNKTSYWYQLQPELQDATLDEVYDLVRDELDGFLGEPVAGGEVLSISEQATTIMTTFGVNTAAAVSTNYEQNNVKKIESVIPINLAPTAILYIYKDRDIEFSSNKVISYKSIFNKFKSIAQNCYVNGEAKIYQYFDEVYTVFSSKMYGGSSSIYSVESISNEINRYSLIYSAIFNKPDLFASGATPTAQNFLDLIFTGGSFSSLGDLNSSSYNYFYTYNDEPTAVYYGSSYTSVTSLFNNPSTFNSDYTIIKTNNLYIADSSEPSGYKMLTSAIRADFYNKFFYQLTNDSSNDINKEILAKNIIKFFADANNINENWFKTTKFGEYSAIENFVTEEQIEALQYPLGIKWDNTNEDFGFILDVIKFSKNDNSETKNILAKLFHQCSNINNIIYLKQNTDNSWINSVYNQLIESQQGRLNLNEIFASNKKFWTIYRERAVVSTSVGQHNEYVDDGLNRNPDAFENLTPANNNSTSVVILNNDNYISIYDILYDAFTSGCRASLQTYSNYKSLAQQAHNENIYNNLKAAYQSIVNALSYKKIQPVTSTYNNENFYIQVYAISYGLEATTDSNGQYEKSTNNSKYTFHETTNANYYLPKINCEAMLLELGKKDSSSFNLIEEGINNKGPVADSNDIYFKNNTKISTILGAPSSAGSEPWDLNKIKLAINKLDDENLEAYSSTTYDNKLTIADAFERLFNIIFKSNNTFTYWCDVLLKSQPSNSDPSKYTPGIENLYENNLKNYFFQIDTEQNILYNILQKVSKCYDLANENNKKLLNSVALSELLTQIMQPNTQIYKINQAFSKSAVASGTTEDPEVRYSYSIEQFTYDVQSLYNLENAQGSIKDTFDNKITNYQSIKNRFGENRNSLDLGNEYSIKTVSDQNDTVQSLIEVFTGSSILYQIRNGYTVIKGVNSYIYKGVDTEAGLRIFNYDNSKKAKAFIKVNDVYIVDPYDTWRSDEVYYEPVVPNKTHIRTSYIACTPQGVKNRIVWIHPTPGAQTAQLINTLAILRVTLKNFGDYDLVACYPIAIKRGTDRNEVRTIIYTPGYIEGATEIRYSTAGETDYEKNPYHMYGKRLVEGNVFESYDMKDEVSNNQVSGWRLLYRKDTDVTGELSNFVPTLKETNPMISELTTLAPGYKYNLPVLHPVTVYIPEAPAYGVQFFLYNDSLPSWTQPIFTYEDNYPSTTLNQWNGKDIVTDEDTGSIVASAIAAGKKESDNTFTGVMMGDWSRTDTDAAITKWTGLYGFNHGSMAYAFKDDGTGFIGKDGRGRIIFDGNKSTIYSNNWKGKYNSGMFLDIDDGIIKLQSEPFEGGTESEEIYQFCHIRTDWKFSTSYASEEIDDSSIGNDKTETVELTLEDVRNLMFLLSAANQRQTSTAVKDTIQNILTGVTTIQADNLWYTTKDAPTRFTKITSGTKYTSIPLESKIYVQKDIGAQNYITISSKESTYPLAIGRSPQLSRRKFKVTWDGTAYISDGYFSGMIYASGGEIKGDMKVKGTLYGGNILGSYIQGSTIVGSHVEADYLKANIKGEIAGWTVTANALVNSDGSTKLFGQIADVQSSNGIVVNNPYGVGIITNRLAISCAIGKAELGYLTGRGYDSETGESFSTNAIGLASSNARLIFHASGAGENGNIAVRGAGSAYLEGKYSKGSPGAAVWVGTTSHGDTNAIIIKGGTLVVENIAATNQWGIYARFA